MKAKAIVGVIGALLPVLYCAGLLYYFLDGSGSIEGAEAIGLGPTLLGLGLIGLIFYIPLVLRLFRMMGAPRSPGSATIGGGDGGGSGGPVMKAAAPKRDEKARDDNSGDEAFDADAAIARYMARRSAEASAGASAPPPNDSGPASFGRRSR